MKWIRINTAVLHKTCHRIVQREKTTTDARGASATVGLQHVTVHDNLTLTQRTHVDGRAQ